MKFIEIDIFGVYVAPIVPMMLAAWAIAAVLRHFADHFGLLRHVWHPVLFLLALYLIVLGAIVLLAASRG
jgi:hypothetical protein